jgi:hypothetical protein
MTLGEVGDRVRAVNFGPSKIIDDNLTVPPGTEGTINFVDGAGTRHVQWDNSRYIGLVPRADDWEVLDA